MTAQHLNDALQLVGARGAVQAAMITAHSMGIRPTFLAFEMAVAGIVALSGDTEEKVRGDVMKVVNARSVATSGPDDAFRAKPSLRVVPTTDETDGVSDVSLP